MPNDLHAAPKRKPFVTIRRLMLLQAAVMLCLWLGTPRHCEFGSGGYFPYGAWYRPWPLAKEVFIGKHNREWSIQVFWSAETRYPSAVGIREGKLTWQASETWTAKELYGD